MKAIVYKEYGNPEVLALKETVKPLPGEDEVLVKIRYASVNSWDWDLLRGDPRIYRLIFGLRRPKYPVIGSDIAGQVEAAGKSARRFKPGDRVFGDISGSGFGAFAEYVSVPEKLLALIPEGVTDKQAASLPQAGVLALQGLRYKGPVKKGEMILVNGAGGGVGTFGLQLAKMAGAMVTCVDTGDKLQKLQELGADHTMDYREEDYTRTGKRYDKILDVVASRSISDYKRALKPGGTFAMIGGAPGLILQMMTIAPLTAMTSGKKIGIMPHKLNPADLDHLAGLVAEGRLLTVTDREFPLSETADALRYFGKGSFFGKIMIRIE